MSVQWTLDRLGELRLEYSEAQARLVQIERQRVEVQESLLQLIGAISVLEELVTASDAFERC